MSNEIIEHVQKVAQSVVDVLENKNLEDDYTGCEWELNTDFYDGKIEGRDEAISLIKKAFQLDEEGE